MVPMLTSGCLGRVLLSLLMLVSTNICELKELNDDGELISLPIYWAVVAGASDLASAAFGLVGCSTIFMLI